MSRMIERKIKLSDTEEVKDFVNAAGKCDFEIDVCYSRAVIDAKSLLGTYDQVWRKGCTF